MYSYVDISVHSEINPYIESNAYDDLIYDKLGISSQREIVNSLINFIWDNGLPSGRKYSKIRSLALHQNEFCINQSFCKET